jgi:XRE family transcriptional regulator, aerobic/anaerobic benzoate catabolism transcriptional regulator
MPRRVLAAQSRVSERYLAQVESGRGNLSLIMLQQIAHALAVSMDALLLDRDEPPVEFAHIVEFLRRLSPEKMKTARQLLFHEFGEIDAVGRLERIALIGLRGAGKSTLGAALAARLRVPFIELDRLIEEQSGLTLDLVFDFHGQAGFRRLELQCLEAVLRQHDRFVLATGGGLVSESGTFERLLSMCVTVWVSATPKEHMQRVLAQGDLRPMAANRHAMKDLSRILAEREVLYSRADMQLNTSGQSPHESLTSLVGALGELLTRDGGLTARPDGKK